MEARQLSHSNLLEEFNRHGYLIINNFIPNSVCDHLRNHARTLIESFDCSSIKAIFSSKDAHSAQQYFLDSGDKISFFFEEGAFDSAGNLRADKTLCINKIGHALHQLDPLFYCFSRLQQIYALLQELEITDPLITQSMYICKQPYFGGEVQCHQDSTYLFVHGRPITGLWFALEDASMENGCLWAIPGGHHTPLKSRMLRDQNDKIEKHVYDTTPWELEKLVPLEVKKGSIIVLHGLLPHMSKENHSPHSRHAYTLHFMSKQDRFAHDNWLRLINPLS